MILKYLAFSLILISSSGFAQTTETVVHPEPKKPEYISESIYEALKKEVAAPPSAGSEAQRRDEDLLVKAQSSRTSKDCNEAKAVVMVSLKSFYGRPAGALTDEEVEKLAPFFEQIRNDGDFFIQKLKRDFPRKRPFLYMAKIKPCVPKEVTGAYPSGHATLANLYALVLGDLFPERASQFMERSKEIAQSRVLSGMHHPSDIEAGRELGSRLYKQLKLSPDFNKSLKEVSATKK